VEGTLDQARRAASRADKRKAEEEQRLAEPITVDETAETAGADGERPAAKRQRVDGADIVLLD
jgi:hypothetical protein